MNNKIVISLLVGLSLMVGFCLYKSMNTPIVKYVRSADLIYGFDGMKEAHLLQQKSSGEIKARLDTLQMDFQHAVNKYNEQFSKLSKAERTTREKILRMQEDNLRKYSQKTEESIKEQDEKLTVGVLNQVNAFVEEYAKKMNYDIVLGTTSSGNILYAKEQMDITDEVIKALNEQYKVNPQIGNEK